MKEKKAKENYGRKTPGYKEREKERNRKRGRDKLKERDGFFKMFL